MKLAVVFLACLASAFAADVTGKWVGQVPGRDNQTREMVFNLKADGDKLTGEVGAGRGTRPIEDGKVSGDEISFTQSFEFNGNAIKFLYKGKLEGDQIKFTREREGGQGRKVEFVAKKAS